MTLNLNLCVIINSCYKFHQKTIPKIIESAKKAKIPGENIFIVVGECVFENIIKTNEYTIIYCKYYNADYNGIIYFTQTDNGLNLLKKFNKFFYTHDTASFQPQFWENINNCECNDYIKLQEYYSKNTGLINIEWFIFNKKELFKYFINYDPSKLMGYKTGINVHNEQLILSKFKNLPKYLNEDSIFLFENEKPMGNYFKNEIKSYIENVYEMPRLVTEYNNPGVNKYQKNWKGDSTWKINL